MSETQKLNLDNFEYCDESECDDSEYEDEEQSECETECEDGSYLPSEINLILKLKMIKYAIIMQNHYKIYYVCMIIYIIRMP